MGKHMTPEDVRGKVAEIEAELGDSEHDHVRVDSLAWRVLETIRDGGPRARQLAFEACKANDLEFERWYA